MHPGVGVPVFSNIEKMLFENLKKIDFFSCTYSIDTYLCKFSQKNTLVCRLHENGKMSK
jgi:hypothetical protein